MRVLVFLLSAQTLFAQLPSLHVKSGEVFQLTGKSFSLDSLVLDDDATLMLDNNFATNFIKTNYLSAGANSMIQSIGNKGQDGAAGADGHYLYAAGKAGGRGFAAVNLILNVSQLIVKDTLYIVLIGGQGGRGGAGGAIIQTNNGTSTVPGSSPRKSTSYQGEPGDGGAGGKAGDLTFSFPEEYQQLAKQKVVVYSCDGDPGVAPGQENPVSFGPRKFTSIGSSNAAQGLFTGKKPGKVRMLVLKK
jgi:hypothetical protein